MFNCNSSEVNKQNTVKLKDFQLPVERRRKKEGTLFWFLNFTIQGYMTDKLWEWIHSSDAAIFFSYLRANLEYYCLKNDLNNVQREWLDKIKKIIKLGTLDIEMPYFICAVLTTHKVVSCLCIQVPALF